MFGAGDCRGRTCPVKVLLTPETDVEAITGINGEAESLEDCFRVAAAEDDDTDDSR